MPLGAFFAFVVAALVSTLGAAFAKPPLEAFANAPEVRSVQLSPDGEGRKERHLSQTEGDAHNLSYTETRRAALEAMSAFVAKFIGGR